MNRPALTNISLYLSGSYISLCHFPNVRTEYVQPRKSLQVDFPKSEKENFDEGIVTPVCFVSSPGGLGMKYKVTHATTHTVFQIVSYIAFLASYRVTFSKILVLFAQEILLPYLEE